MRGKQHWNRRAAALGAGLAGAGLVWAGLHRPRGASTINFPRGLPRTLRRGNAAEPATLDPHKLVTQWEDWIVGDMMVGLMHQDAAGRPTPCAATGFTTSADGLTHTIHLREHLWSDGAPVTAEDYVFSLRRIADPKTAAQYVSILYPILNMQQAAEAKVPPETIGVRALDARTLEIRTHYQTPYIDQLMMHQTMYAVPRHVVERHGDAWLRPENIAVNGPFILKEWLPNDHVRLVKNTRFYDAAKVELEEVWFYPTEDSEAALKRLRAGELDLCNRCPVQNRVAAVRRELPGLLRISPAVSTFYLLANFSRPPYNDLRVRQALAMSIDRDTIYTKVMNSGLIPARNFIPPGIAGYPYSAKAGYEAMPFAVRQEKARALLKAAGYGPERPLTFDFTMYNKLEFKLTAVALQAMWAEVGIHMRPLPIDSQILFAMQRSHDFDVAVSAWVADYRDPKNFLFLCQTASTDLNYGLYSNPGFDKLVDDSDHIRDPAQRMATLAEAEQILLDDLGVIPLYHDTTRDLVSPQVKGWVSNPSNMNRSRYLSLDRSVQKL
ncbi:MAG: peptide ABC transporter substrate-binding protein [Alphaproteobacteria bacterium]|nr:peptide ABC transporter substrate-binding protein [Alphaproteobacteria bacterium]